MAGKEPDIGPTARAVAENVARLRKRLRMNYTELSEALQAQAGWSINAVGVRRIESGERRVTPDDLMALSLALGVTPISLLMPDYDSLDRDDLVDVTGKTEPVAARRLWDWLRAEQTLSDSYSDTSSYFAFIMAASPRWLRERREELFREDMERVSEALRREVSDGND